MSKQEIVDAFRLIMASDCLVSHTDMVQIMQLALEGQAVQEATEAFLNSVEDIERNSNGCGAI